MNVPKPKPPRVRAKLYANPVEAAKPPVKTSEPDCTCESEFYDTHNGSIIHYAECAVIQHRLGH